MSRDFFDTLVMETNTVNVGHQALPKPAGGVIGSAYFSYFLLAVTGLLVFLEFRYNIALLNSISDPNTTPAQADQLSNKGKLLAAFGLTWAIFRGLLLKAKNLIVGIIGLAIMTTLGYFALDTIYDKAIENLKPEIKVMGYNLLLYRQDLLKGDLEDPDIPKLDESPVIGRIFMGAFPIVLLDDRFMIPAQDIVSRRADEKQADALAMSEEKWEDYSSNMLALRKAYDRFIDASRKAKDGTGLDGDWQKYRTEMEKLASAYKRYIDAARRARGEANLSDEWGRYNTNMDSIRSSYQDFINGSRKVASHNYHPRAIAQFRQQSGGLDPNTGLQLAQFPSLIKRSSHSKAHQIRQAEARVIGQYFDGRKILAGEMPYFMPRSDFDRWIANKSKDVLTSAGLPIDSGISRDNFLNLIRNSNSANGEELRQYEKREIGQRKNGEKVLAKDMPYFMEREVFMKWTMELAGESMEAIGLSPNPKLTMNDFLQLLRKSNSEDGKRLRDAEAKVVAKRPDGTSMLVKDVPYFMNRSEYQAWVQAESEKLRAMAMPTVDNVDNLKNIKQINAAIFIPPMAMISSLTSALVNAISLLLTITASLLIVSGTGAAAGRFVRRYNVILMLLAFALLLVSMPAHVFEKNTELYNLETKLHQEVGTAAEIWSRLSNIQKYFL